MKLFSQALSNKYLNMRKAMTPPMLGMREDSISEQNLPIVPPSRGGGMLPAPQESEDEQQKRGLFSSIGNVLNKPTDNLDEQDDTGFDDLDKKYGLKKPEIKKESVFSKIMAYALPTLLTAADGKGILPGLAGAYMGRKIGKARAEEKALDRYQTGRKEAIGLEKEYRTIRRQEARDKALDDYRNKSLDAMGARSNQTETNREQDKSRQYRIDESNLRKEFSNDPIVKQAKLAAIGYSKIKEAAANPSATGFNDQALIFNFMKVLDPDSVVRESEYATTAKNASLLERMGISLQRLENGEQLTPAQRMKIVQAAERQYKANADKYKQSRSEMQRIAHGYGYNPENVTPDFGIDDDNGDNTDQGDEQALEWARSHPDDPRAQEILRMHGVQ